MLLLKPKKKILHIVLADDDVYEGTLFKNALMTLHIPFSFSHARNVETLLNMLDEGDFIPDFIFMDLHVNNISGEDCLEALKSRKKLKSVPVILYSESVNPKDKDYCYNFSANEYFLKALFFLL